MANTYDRDEVYKIKFTDEDVALAVSQMDKTEHLKTIATLSIDEMSGEALRAFGNLADALNASVHKQYGTLEIMVPKPESEIADQALYRLRFYSNHEDLRDLRAAEQGIEPKNDPKSD